MNIQKYIVTIEMPDGDMISSGWLKDLIQGDCDAEDEGRSKVFVEEISTSKDLEEAAEEYAYSWRKEGNKEVRELFPGTAYRAFIAGAKWQKEQMLKDAVEGYVNYYEDGGGKLMAEAQVGCPYHIGDKARIIIVKAEEE